MTPTTILLYKKLFKDIIEMMKTKYKYTHLGCYIF